MGEKTLKTTPLRPLVRTKVDTLWKVWSALWRVALFFVGWGALAGLFIVPVVIKHVPHGDALSPPLRLYVEAVGLFAVLIAAWLMVRLADRRPFISLGFGSENAAPDFATGLVLGVGMMGACVALLFLFGWATWSEMPLPAVAPLVLSTLAMLLNTVTQEVLVRGYFQQTVQFRFGTVAGVIISSLLFVAMHLGAIGSQLLPALSLFAAGALLGTCYAIRGNLWLPIGLHFGWNVLQGPVLGGAVSGQALNAGDHLLNIAGPSLMTGGKFGIEGGLIAIAITSLGTPLILSLYQRPRIVS
jgi:membrane protease YdiL (CAAX protease family)